LSYCSIRKRDQLIRLGTLPLVAGLSLPEVQKLLCHRSPTMTSRCIRLAERHCRTTGEDTLVEPAVAPPASRARASTTPPCELAIRPAYAVARGF
jgi:hypothetical protein